MPSRFKIQFLLTSLKNTRQPREQTTIAANTWKWNQRIVFFSQYLDYLNCMLCLILLLNFFVTWFLISLVASAAISFNPRASSSLWSSFSDFQLFSFSVKQKVVEPHLRSAESGSQGPVNLQNSLGSTSDHWRLWVN